MLKVNVKYVPKLHLGNIMTRCKFFSNNLGTTEASITPTHSLKINIRKINSANYVISTRLSHVHTTLNSRVAFTFKENNGKDKNSSP